MNIKIMQISHDPVIELFAISYWNIEIIKLDLSASQELTTKQRHPGRLNQS